MIRKYDIRITVIRKECSKILALDTDGGIHGFEMLVVEENCSKTSFVKTDGGMMPVTKTNI